TGHDSGFKELSLPTESSSDLQELVEICQPASCGKGDKDVIDPKYRQAGKLDAGCFLTTFQPEHFGIIESIEETLLPAVTSTTDDGLQFRKIRAELYKLNVYSGPSGHFHKHVNTPRSDTKTGSLVVCLPSQFKGGNLIIRHNKQETNYDWSPRGDSTIQWAAFYSDCEHEMNTVTECNRITLAYNLHVTKMTRPEIELYKTIVDPETFPSHEKIRQHLADPEFMTECGVIGFYCSHAYPQTTNELPPPVLKGIDHRIYAIFESLGMNIGIHPILECVPEDLHLAGGVRVGLNHQTYRTTDRGGEDDCPEDDIWPSRFVRGITWITEPKHEQMAFSHVVYGNEASIGTRYSSVAILVIIPPHSQRGL
ncbi:hypothetical protein BO71DRAFT_457421, partial [Aspergillus ellipticus CBS 707.79]